MPKGIRTASLACNQTERVTPLVGDPLVAEFLKQGLHAAAHLEGPPGHIWQESNLSSINVPSVPGLLKYVLFDRVIVQATKDISGSVFRGTSGAKSSVNPVHCNGCLRRALQAVIKYGSHLKVSLSGGLWQAANSDIAPAVTIFQIVHK